MLPPGGGDGQGLTPSEVQAALAESLFEIAERMAPIDRRFAETFAETRDTSAAVAAAVPSLADADESKKAARAMAFFERKDVQDYLKAATGIGAIGHGLNYGAILQQTHMLASDENTPAYVKAACLATLAKELRESGVAALQGCAVPDKKDGEKRSAGAMPKEMAAQFLTLLKSSPPVPKLGGGTG
jgi:hypothetical protein